MTDWHDVRIAGRIDELFCIGEQMGEVVRFISKSERERARLIREARANYERVFPSHSIGSEQADPSEGNGSQASSDP
ncbi:hypothetical protein [Bradyrhizobium macuxiense]|uniref:hypothetical protein n=1 Tax=Bradyrhizobium macuxiense TaxID=1755647 RepID=UPI0010A95B8C|nr:hypothetical protein [Bradyrhizobium macuxiense]